jgi:hypothetical protein
MNVSVDIVAIQEIAQRGVRRTFAFLGLGLSALRDGPPTSVTLENRFLVQWLPDPLPAESAAEIAHEYEAWIIGSALRELDQHFGLFLDEVWEWTRLGDFHGRQIPAEFGPDQKFKQTNVCGKLAQVEAKLGIKGISSDFFSSYTLARNALSHNNGVVRLRDTNRSGSLSIRWHTPTVVIKADGKEHIFDQHGESPDRIFGSDAEAVFRMSEREAVILEGQRIALSRFDLCGICISYQNAAETVSNGLAQFLKGKCE